MEPFSSLRDDKTDTPVLTNNELSTEREIPGFVLVLPSSFQWKKNAFVE